MNIPEDKIADPVQCGRVTKYIVLKISDIPLDQYQGTFHEVLQRHIKAREVRGAAPLDCVVVESDWPMYEQTWAAIDAWCDAECERKGLPRLGRCVGQPSELEMHRADYAACQAAGFSSPGELLDAYQKLLAQQGDQSHGN